MNVATAPRPSSSGQASLAIVDSDIHPLLRNPDDIKAYLPQRWRDHFDAWGNHFRQPFAGSDIYPKVAPYISRRDAYPPTGGPPGSDLDFMSKQHLDPHNVEVGVLQVLAPTGSNQRNQDYGTALCRAVNDWQIAEWTSRDRRLRGSLVVTQEDAEAAVAEIARHDGRRDFAQVSVAQRSLEPLGRRRYWPIFQAAEERGLAIGIHSGGNNGHPPVPGGGWPSFYAEQHHLISLGMQALVASLIMEGVFERFPKLRVVLIEGGFTWLPALMWRLDRLWEAMRSEVPHVRRRPSDYARAQIWLSTQPMEEVQDPLQLRQVFDWVGWDRLLFASDYPHWDYDDTRYAFPFRMSADERRMVFRDNGRLAFGLQ